VPSDLAIIWTKDDLSRNNGCGQSRKERAPHYHEH
jgi:hypothetical protein